MGDTVTRSSVEMKRKPSLAALRRKLDKLFSAWIRKRDHGKPCITCGKRTELQAGHFVKRQHMSVRWDERNVHGQCVRCNHFLNGNDGEYAYAILNLYGQWTLDQLMGMKHKTAKFTRSDLEELIAKYST